MASTFFDKRRGHWKIKYRPDPKGEWVVVTLGEHPGAWSAARPPKKVPDLIEEKAAKFRQIEYDAKHGFKAAPAKAQSVADYLLGYIESRKLRNKTGSIAILQRIVDVFLAFVQQERIGSIQGVTKAHCRKFLDARLRAVSGQSATTERGYLQGAFSRATKDEVIRSNPWTYIRVEGKVPETSITFWRPDEIEAIVREAQPDWVSDLILVMANTGLRISTACSMRWDWIDWSRGVIKIPSGIEGVKTSYTHAMSDAARDILTRMLSQSNRTEHVFSARHDPSKRLSYRTARDAITRAIVAAKVRTGTPHDFRHSYGRGLALAGVPANIIQAQLGHTTINMTLKYMKVGSEEAAPFVASYRVGLPAEPPAG